MSDLTIRPRPVFEAGRKACIDGVDLQEAIANYLKTYDRNPDFTAYNVVEFCEGYSKEQAIKFMEKNPDVAKSLGSLNMQEGRVVALLVKVVDNYDTGDLTMAATSIGDHSQMLYHGLQILDMLNLRERPIKHLGDVGDFMTTVCYAGSYERPQIKVDREAFERIMQLFMSSDPESYLRILQEERQRDSYNPPDKEKTSRCALEKLREIHGTA
jgi:hypothetical protein